MFRKTVFTIISVLFLNNFQENFGKLYFRYCDEKYFKIRKKNIRVPDNEMVFSSLEMENVIFSL